MITTKITNNRFFPAYNNQYVVLDSSNINKTKFKYICQIFDMTPSELARLRVTPNREGFGVIDINNILKDYISYELNYDVAVKQLNTNHFFKYDLEFGEEYTVDWVATSTSIGSNSNTILNGTMSHIFGVNDLINIESNDLINIKDGRWRVTDVPSLTQLEINQVFTSPTVGMFTASYVDNRATQFLGLETSYDKYIFNGSNSFDDNSDWVFDEWEIGLTPGKLITNIPEYLEINIDDYFTANYFGSENGIGGFDNLEIVFTTSTTSAVFSLGVSSDHGTIGMGPENLKTWSTAYNNIAIGSTYSIKILNIPRDTYSNEIVFKVVERCTKYENYKIVWLDRMGGWKTFNFENQSSKKVKSKKQEFEKENIGRYDSISNKYIIDKEEFGTRVEKIDFTEIYNINSGLLTHYQILSLEDLFTSKYVFHIKDGVAHPILLETNSFDVVDLLYERSKTISIDFKYSNKNHNN